MQFKIIFIFLLVFIVNPLFAQKILQGVVTSDKNQPILYANVGIINGKSGTVTDEQGSFTLKIEKEDEAKTLRISNIGYESKEFKVSALDFNQPLKVTLPEKIYELETVPVETARFTKTKVLGHTNQSNKVIMSFQSNKSGTELGNIIKIKKTQTWIKEARFNIAANPKGRLIFRVNIYKVQEGKILDKLLKEDVIVETSITTGELKVDLSSYNIVVDNDILLSLEWVNVSDTDNKSSLEFCAGPFNGPAHFRYTSQSAWREMGKQGIFNAGVGFNVLVKY